MFKDVQVPVCPLCNKPVPVARGELPDIKVGQHIDRDCQSDPAKAKRISDSHRCTLKGCKQKEVRFETLTELKPFKILKSHFFVSVCRCNLPVL